MNYYLHVLKNYANFNGRARRKEYWMFFLINILISFGLAGVGGIFELEILSTIYTFAVLIPSIAVAVRRMHDVDKSGWFILIPIYNFILGVTEGTKGSNQYGNDPKQEDLELTDHIIGE